MVMSLLLVLLLLLLVLPMAYYVWHRRREELAKRYEDLEAAQRERHRLADEAAARLAERRAQIEDERRRALQEAWKDMGLSNETQARELAKREAAEQARFKARSAAAERKARDAELKAAQTAAWKAQLAASHMVEDGNGGFVYSYEADQANGGSAPPLGVDRGAAGNKQAQARGGQSADQAAMAARVAQIEAAQAAAEAHAEAAYREELQAAAVSRADQAERTGKLQARLAAQRLKEYRAKQEAEEAAANSFLLFDDGQGAEMHMMFKHREIKAPTPTLLELRSTPPTLHFQPATSPQRAGGVTRKGWLPSAGWKTKEAIKAESEQSAGRLTGRASPRPSVLPIAKPESASDWLRSWFSNRGAGAGGSPRGGMKAAVVVAGEGSSGANDPPASPNKYRELVNKYSC